GLRPLAAAAMTGILARVVGKPGVNLVNALLLAQQRGIALRRVRLDPVGDYAQFLELKVSTETGGVRVAGALLAAAHARLVRIDDYHVDIVPRGSLVILRNRDVPGVIGRVGSLLGDAGVNIGEYHQARLEAGGTALAAISVDGRLPAGVADRLRGLPEVTEVHEVFLES
ncbi:MAG: ACT domain-containing protein, partial [Gemmatimonadales bacterium]